MSEVGAEGDGCLRLHHVCPRVQAERQEGCSLLLLPPTLSLENHVLPPHPRLPARAQPSGTGWRLP